MTKEDNQPKIYQRIQTEGSEIEVSVRGSDDESISDIEAIAEDRLEDLLRKEKEKFPLKSMMAQNINERKST